MFDILMYLLSSLPNIEDQVNINIESKGHGTMDWISPNMYNFNWMYNKHSEVEVQSCGKNTPLEIGP
jgi:hypothetical protein